MLMLIGIVLGGIILVGVMALVRRHWRKKTYDLEELVANQRLKDELAKEKNEFLNRNPDIQQSPWNKIPPGF